MTITKSGSQPSAKGPADWFTGSVRIDSPSSWPPNRGKSAAPGIHTTRSAGRPTSRQRASICRDTANATAVRRCSAVAATPRLTERALW